MYHKYWFKFDIVSPTILHYSWFTKLPDSQIHLIILTLINSEHHIVRSAQIDWVIVWSTRSRTATCGAAGTRRWKITENVLQINLRLDISGPWQKATLHFKMRFAVISICSIIAFGTYLFHIKDKFWKIETFSTTSILFIRGSSHYTCWIYFIKCILFYAIVIFFTLLH